MIRVLTINMYATNSEPASLAAVLDRHRPDVVAAQELSPRAGAVLAERYPFGMIRPALNHRGAALVAARPMEVSRHPLPHRPGLVGTLAVDGGRHWRLWSVHMVNPADWPPPVGLRRLQVEALLAATSNVTAPLAVVGDFNATPLWPLYRKMIRQFSDGVVEWAESSGEEPPKTWSYRPGWKPLLRIDHVFVRRLSVVRAEAVAIEGSDHRGVLVDLEECASGPINVRVDR